MINFGDKNVLNLDNAVVVNKIYIYPIGLICFVANLMWLMVFNESTPLVILFSIGIILSLFLVFNELLQNLLRVKTAIFVVIPILYLFPFQQLMSLTFSQTKMPMYIYYFFTLVIILNVINRYWVLTWYFLAFLFAFLSSYFTGNFFVLTESYLLSWFTSILFITSYLYFYDLKTKELELKTRTLRLIGGAIAHELRTPLASMISGARGIQKFLPRILEGYNECAQYLKPQERIDKNQLTKLGQVARNMENTGREACIMIDMFLVKIRGVGFSFTDICSIKSIVQEALDEYPLDDNLKNVVEFNDEHAFFVLSNQRALKHVLFNLLKNAVYQIKKNKKGKILISFETNDQWNELHFKDTAVGIPSEKLKYIFDEFYTDTLEGTGLGLPFCKLVMNFSNGIISCQSEHGEYTEFILSFPRLR